MHKILINKKSPFIRGFLLFSEAGCLLLASIELVHRTRFEKSFLSRIEWMTFWTCFHADFTSFDRTERIESMSARTDNFYLLHVGVNIFFHKWKWVKSNCNRSSQNDRVRRPLLLFYKNWRRRKPEEYITQDERRWSSIISNDLFEVWCPGRDLNSYT